MPEQIAKKSKAEEEAMKGNVVGKIKKQHWK